jgi:hypothetical protein
MNVYEHLLEDEKAIHIPFTLSFTVTITTINGQLKTFLVDLENKECQEIPDIDFDLMTDIRNIMSPKLKSDMAALDNKTIREHLEELFGEHMDKRPSEVYEFIYNQTLQMTDKLKQAREGLEHAEPALFEKYVRRHIEQGNWDDVRDRYSKWKKKQVDLSMETLLERQEQELRRYIDWGIMRFAPTPSHSKMAKADYDLHRDLQDCKFEDSEEHQIAYTQMMQFASRQDGMLTIDLRKYGKYIFNFFYQFSESQKVAVFELCVALDLIHEDMASLNQSDKPISVEDRIRHSIELLMKEQYDGEPLFNQQNHWQAVYRILVDKEYCRDSDFEGFDAFILKVMPSKVNKPYKKDSVKHISQTSFVLPFDRWKYDSSLSGNRKPYERMVLIATRFKAILEENGL